MTKAKKKHTVSVIQLAQTGDAGKGNLCHKTVNFLNYPCHETVSAKTLIPDETKNWIHRVSDQKA
jgi:hypothetical protein